MEHNFDQFEQDIQEKPIDWRELIEKYIVYWRWILASIVLATAVGFFYIRTQPNVYELNTSLLVVDQSKAGGMNEMSILKSLDVMGTGNSYTMVNNENEVIKSTALMKRVVNQLELYTTYSTTNFLRTTEIYSESPYRVRMDSMAMEKLKGPFKFEIVTENGKLMIEGEYADSVFTNKVDRLPALLNTPAGVISIDIRYNKVIPAEPLIVTISKPASVAKYYATKVLATEITKLVDVVTLSVKVNNIQKGKDVLNTLTEIYNRDAIEQINRSANNTAGFIDGRLRLISGELSDVERDVENYKQVNQLTDISSNAKIYLERNNEFDQQRITVETQLSLIRFVEEFINKPVNQTALIPNLGLTDVGLVTVIQKYNELVINRERVASGSSEENPVIRTLNQQIASARKAIQISIANSRKGMEISKRELDQQNSLAVSKIRDLPRQEREFIEIKRQQQVKESLYLFLLQKREEASLTMAVTVPKGRVLSSPDDALKVAPRSAMLFAVFFLLGLILPLVVIFIRDALNTTLSSRKQIEGLTDVPILSELGHNGSNQIILDHSSNADTNVELFRLLRTKLQFVLQYPTQKVIMVTSTEPGEGKSYTSINLAISLSMTDKKVILLGLDLRKPQLKRHLNIAMEEGMSSYLSGNEPDYKKLIQVTPNNDNLHVISGGFIPPNPNELLMSKRLDTLIETLRKEYDYIVIDTAPVGSVSDTMLINRITDISLYMCRMDYSDKSNMDFLNQVRKEQNLRRPYLVLNDVNLTSKYYYKRGYSYGYGNYHEQASTKKKGKK